MNTGKKRDRIVSTYVKRIFCFLQDRKCGTKWFLLILKCNPGVLLFGGILLGLLLYSFYLVIGAPLEARPMAFATIATGMALAAVAYLTYRLQKRAFDLSHEPLLGIILREALRVREIKGDDKKPVIVEFLLWNAGDVPILIWLVNRVVIDGTLPDIDGQELEFIGTGKSWRGKGFPIVLGKETLCVWRIFTSDLTYFTPEIGYIVEDEREKAVSWIKGEPKSGEPVRRYLFEVIYTHHTPIHMRSQRDVKRQFVGFYYRLD